MTATPWDFRSNQVVGLSTSYNGKWCASILDVAQPVQVQGKDGWSGIIHSWARGSDEITLRLDNGEKLVLPASLLTTRPDGSYYAPLSLGEIRGTTPAPQSPAGPIVHEEVGSLNQEIDAGPGVRIQKSALEESKTVDVPLLCESVDVERVRVDKAVDGPVPVRQVGDTLIVPVVEEVLVVQKQLRLVEELHIRKSRTERHAPQTVKLRKEQVTVEPLEGDPVES